MRPITLNFVYNKFKRINKYCQFVMKPDDRNDIRILITNELDNRHNNWSSNRRSYLHSGENTLLTVIHDRNNYTNYKHLAHESKKRKKFLSISEIQESFRQIRMTKIRESFNTLSYRTSFMDKGDFLNNSAHASFEIWKFLFFTFNFENHSILNTSHSLERHKAIKIHLPSINPPTKEK